MIANTEHRYRVRLRKDRFDARADQVFGENTPDYVIADQLNVDPATFSLVRNGHRPPLEKFIASVLVAFRDQRTDEPFADFKDYFTVQVEPAEVVAA